MKPPRVSDAQEERLYRRMTLARDIYVQAITVNQYLGPGIDSLLRQTARDALRAANVFYEEAFSPQEELG